MILQDIYTRSTSSNQTELFLNSTKTVKEGANMQGILRRRKSTLSVRKPKLNKTDLSDLYFNHLELIENLLMNILIKILYLNLGESKVQLSQQVLSLSCHPSTTEI